MLHKASRNTGVSALINGLIIAFMSMVFVAPLYAQPLQPGIDPILDSARAESASNLDIAVLTFANGEILWERFGHNALIVTDKSTGEGKAYNWGVFDFDQPNFLTRFLTGDTRYWLAVYRASDMLAAYIAEDRSARLQTLTLTDIQKGALAEFLEWNAMEENRYYRYDYYLDNCSTRVRDALDWALGGSLVSSLQVLPDIPTTWREETKRVTDGDWLPYAGINIALGRNADIPLTKWNESFMPGRLADHIAGTSVSQTNTGEMVSLVERDTILYSAARLPLPEVAPDRIPIAALIGLIGAALILCLAFWHYKGSDIALILLRVIATSWYSVSGILGTALFLAGTVTKHAPYMGSNATLFQLHPLLLIAAVYAPFHRLDGTSSRAFTWIVLSAGFLAVVGAVVQAIMLPQNSGIVMSVTLPIHLALAYVMTRRLPVSRSVSLAD